MQFLQLLCVMCIQKKSNPEDLYNVVIFDNCKFPDKIICNILLITMTRKKLRGHI